ncbi:Rossmann fold nucleotide-binding protein for DNA uptake [Lactobacillus hominis DSM 23910 = CRBIP 24.179]|uniref:DNA protecting protein DprA n=1 Tax=Lactobacillus hominis DSM 23910 = CRBIP 24.179 TaxID=1423758 RepID=I7L5R3_9LACO|nr:DNA-processing protein DprA [Lactobacillus hominis]KRM85884.1 Rossmann fold nucleotide-binding protein for DNA uptake [Lactobacillus hominis DSM 23910 = CRBIP 24.179]MCT3348881.1 DNA-processing protein DprA [Lactobacillus hominis]CCI81562.1 DNA protecting protein DprA [Lactobacillus hominis DSM 23910 = CRBIP 24.179]
MNPKEFCLRLKLQKGLGYASIKKVIDQLGYYEEKINFDLINELELSSDLRNKIFDAMTDVRFEKCIERILLQCEVITIFDPIYPDKLKETFDPPIVLFARGDLELLKKKITVIVGSRTPTQYSRKVLQELVPNLIKQDFVIASGLAKGVDGIAHEETLKNNGETIAVVGNGLNHFYPRQNMELQKEIIKHGLLLSEYLPDTPPLPFRFPERNII